MQSEAPTPQQVAAAGERFWTALAKHPHSYNVFAKYYSFLVGFGRRGVGVVAVHACWVQF